MAFAGKAFTVFFGGFAATPLPIRFPAFVAGLCFSFYYGMEAVV